ncbi:MULTISPECIES: LysR substrate-binding domain-containing protein [unclassified Paraburkholderia]|uniref:LysR substrate-binding domain-containing protein n=1 Tax=unclassified Paraburkholderia TaxID=2615204 RepID=UPI002AB0F7A8|nr:MULTISPECIES: LysR substrate-binding domain-containing protein [unclassified Paraburkholderia]
MLVHASGAITGAIVEQALRKLRLRDLETLRILDKTRSFARTSEAVALSQPALSKWLRELESALGIALFERTTRRVAPTSYGEALLEFVGRVLAEMQNVGPTLEALRTGTGRPVSLGCLPNMAQLIVPGTLGRLVENGHSIRLNVQEGSFTSLLTQVERRELDVLVCHQNATVLSSGLEVVPLYRDEISVVCGPKHPLMRRKTVTWQDAAEFPWIAPPSGTAFRNALNREFAEAGVAPPRVMLETLSKETSALIAQRLPCLYITSFKNWRLADRRGEKVHRLPLRITTIPEAVCAAFCKPAGFSVGAVIEAMKQIDFEVAGVSGYG